MPIDVDLDGHILALKQQILAKKIQHKPFDDSLVDLHLQHVLDALLTYDLDVLDRARFGLQNLLDIDGQSINFILIVELQKLVNKFINSVKPTSLIDSKLKWTEKDAEHFLSAVEPVFQHVSGLGTGFSLLEYDTLDLTELESSKNASLDLLISMLQRVDNLEESGQNELATTFPYLVISLKLLKDFDKFEVGYFLGALISDKLHTLGDYQLARDFVENFIHLSMKEKKNLELAHFVLAATYIRQGNLFKSLFHVCAALKGLIRIGLVEKKIFIRLILDSQKIFRNVPIPELEERLFLRIKKEKILKDIDADESFHIHALTKLVVAEPTIVNEVYQFLLDRRESIIGAGVYACSSWYNTLRQFERIYGDSVSENLHPFIELFSRPLSKELRERIDGALTSKKELLVGEIYRELKSLSKTRYNSDLKTDVRRAAFLGARAVSMGVLELDAEVFFLGANLLADFSLGVEDIDLGDKFYKFGFEKDELSFQAGEQYRLESFRPTSAHFDFLVLAHDDYNLNYLSSLNSESRIGSLPQTIDFYRTKLDEEREFFDYKDEIQVGRLRLPIDAHMRTEDLNEFKQRLGKMPLQAGRVPLLVLKDQAAAQYPSNFLQDDQGCLMTEMRPVCNIPSSGLFIKRSWREINTINYTQAEIWTPICDGDGGLNKLFSDLEPTIKRNFTKVYEDVLPDVPLQGQLNVIIAHGASDIGATGFFFTGQRAITDFTKVLGKGKVAILFVCHSGSEKESVFMNSIDSVARKLIQSGYEAVIAPFWALNIEVPKIWLPVFLEQMLAKETFLESFYRANQEVKRVNPHPGAWNCLHYYGNPFIRIQ